jgi:acyl-CoA reductase-like NAD-dependent aldehyde dehydrogenase
MTCAKTAAGSNDPKNLQEGVNEKPFVPVHSFMSFKDVDEVIERADGRP